MYEPALRAIQPTIADAFNLREVDYCLGDLKFGGNAQGKLPPTCHRFGRRAQQLVASATVANVCSCTAISKNRWVHHTSFLWDWEQDRMDCLTLPPSMPEYRGGRNHEDFLTRLKEHLPSRSALSDAVPAALHQVFDVQDASWADFETAAAQTARGKRISTHYVDLHGWTQEGPPEGVGVRGNPLPPPER